MQAVVFRRLLRNDGLGEGTRLPKGAERCACAVELRKHLGGVVGADQKVRFRAVRQKLLERGLLLGTNEMA